MYSSCSCGRVPGCVCLFFWLLFKSCAATLQDGWTALYCAAWEGHTAAVEALVAAGADMNIGDKVSLTTSVVIVVHALSGFHTGICCWVGGGEEVMSKHTPTQALAGMPCSETLEHASISSYTYRIYHIIVNCNIIKFPAIR